MQVLRWQHLPQTQKHVTKLTRHYTCLSNCAMNGSISFLGVLSNLPFSMPLNCNIKAKDVLSLIIFPPCCGGFTQAGSWAPPHRLSHSSGAGSRANLQSWCWLQALLLPASRFSFGKHWGRRLGVWDTSHAWPGTSSLWHEKEEGQVIDQDRSQLLIFY